MSATLRVIVTRPVAQAAQWVEALHRQGLDAVALPLIAIDAAPDAAAVTAAWAALESYRLVVFVSPNAAQAFFDAAPPTQRWPVALRAASPGPGTAALLRQLGVAPGCIVEPAVDAVQFDSESLWPRLEADDWRGAAVLIVRGAGGRNWLASRLVERGARVDLLAAYGRSTPAWSPAQRARLDAARAHPDGHLWLFSSSEAIDRLARLAVAFAPGVADAAGALPGAEASTWAEARALATHPRIAARAQQLGFGRVAQCRPMLPAVVACIQSLTT